MFLVCFKVGLRSPVIFLSVKKTKYYQFIFQPSPSGRGLERKSDREIKVGEGFPFLGQVKALTPLIPLSQRARGKEG